MRLLLERAFLMQKLRVFWSHLRVVGLRPKKVAEFESKRFNFTGSENSLPSFAQELYLKIISKL
jgi:hypothetical protein